MGHQLRLTTDQRTRVTAAFDAMLSRAQELGERIIEAERHLSRRFEHGRVDSAIVHTATAEIGRLTAELRSVHMTAHLVVKDVLTSEQVASYDRLRGNAHHE